MSREFDIDKMVGRKMPYKAPGAEFFAEVSANVLERVEREAQPRVLPLSRRIVASCVAVAASVVLFCGFYISAEYNAADSLVGSDLSEYISELSDDELMVLFNDMELEDTFYSAL